jgi:hypothetical protein
MTEHNAYNQINMTVPPTEGTHVATLNTILKYFGCEQETIIGDGSTSSWELHHNLNTVNILTSVKDASTNEEVIVKITFVDGNTVRIDTARPLPVGTSFIVTLIRTDLTPSLIRDNDAYTLVTPDYASTEAASLFSTLNTSIITNKAGYLRVLILGNVIATASDQQAQISVRTGNADSPVSEMQTQLRSCTVKNPPIGSQLIVSGILPIVANQKIEIVNQSGTGVELSTDFYVNYVPPKFTNVIIPKVSSDYMNVAMVPDYEKQEAINRLPTVNDQWIADRTGFLAVSVGYTHTSKTFDVKLNINNRNVIPFYSTNNIADPVVTKYGQIIIPISTGDVIKWVITGTAVIGFTTVYFIPAKFNTLSSSSANVIIANTSYSATEIQTGETWIDNKPIYRTTIELGTFPNDDIKSIPHGITNIDNIIKYEGIAKNTTPTFIALPYASTSYGSVTSDAAVSGQITVDINKTSILIFAGKNRTDFTGYLTIYYTKTTD